MKKLSPVVVAFVSFCLISFHSNPAFAAVIDAVAPPEDAVAVPLELEEPDDATAAAVAASVVDAIPEEAASVPSRRRRTLAAKKGGGTVGSAPVSDSLVTSLYEYTTYVINKTGKPLFVKIGPEEQPLLCQSEGKIVPNRASKDSGTYTIVGNGGIVLSPICNDAALASAACSAPLTGDNVQGTKNICDLKDGTGESVCQCMYKKEPEHCEPKELCKYCKRGLVTKKLDSNHVFCVEQTDFSPYYELGVFFQVAVITRTGDGVLQRLVASDAPFGWNPFEAQGHGQTLFEFTFQANRITHDISIIPSGCDDIAWPGSRWQSHLGWGTQQAECASVPANQFRMPSCPRCKDNKKGPAFNFGGKSSCDDGNGPEWSCLGPVEGTWSTGIGQGWPTFCGNPDNSCDVSSTRINNLQPTVANEGCTQAFFHPNPTPNPNWTCDPYSAVTISICDPTKNSC